MKRIFTIIVGLGMLSAPAWAGPATSANSQVGLANSLTTYTFSSAAFVGTGGGNAATDMFCLTGSATKTVYVSNIDVRVQSTAAALITFFWIKRSTADTGGVAVNPAVLPYDSADAAATAVANMYTTSPTLGSAVATLRQVIFLTTVLTAAPAATSLSAVLSIGNGTLTNALHRPLTLRGVNESMCLNFNGATLPAGFTTNITGEWIEGP